MKPDCPNCYKGECYHLDVNNLLARIDILESAVDLLEERLSRVLDMQTLEPYEIELSDEDAQKIKDWVNGTGL